MMRRKKALATFGLVCALPVVFAVPQITQYPLTVIGGIIGAIYLVNIAGEPGEPSGEVSDGEFTGYRDRARATTAPGC